MNPYGTNLEPVISNTKFCHYFLVHLPLIFATNFLVISLILSSQINIIGSTILPQTTKNGFSKRKSSSLRYLITAGLLGLVAAIVGGYPEGGMAWEGGWGGLGGVWPSWTLTWHVWPACGSCIRPQQASALAPPQTEHRSHRNHQKCIEIDVGELRPVSKGFCNQYLLGRGIQVFGIGIQLSWSRECCTCAPLQQHSIFKKQQQKKVFLREQLHLAGSIHYDILYVRISCATLPGWDLAAWLRRGHA